MKKKLLSLVLAGAMVASTSVSAFADEITIDGNGKEHKIEMTGRVEDQDGNLPSGTITVTVPSSVAFTIDQNGDINAGTIEIVNRNSEKEKVKVIVKEFNDLNPTNGIVLVKEGVVDSKDNTDSLVHAALRLQGDKTSVELVSSKSDSVTGLINTQGQQIQATEETILGEAWDTSSLTLKLIGRTKNGYTAPAVGSSIKNNFSLFLKIKKSQ